MLLENKVRRNCFFNLITIHHPLSYTSVAMADVKNYVYISKILKMLFSILNKDF